MKRIWEVVSGVFEGLLGLACCLYVLSLLYAGLGGIANLFGFFWGSVALGISWFFRSPFLIIIGAYFYAKDIWHWHYAWAALFAFPGLAIIMPVTVIIMIVAPIMTAIKHFRARASCKLQKTNL